MARSEFERKADQLRAQMETLRGNVDDMLKGYNRLVVVAGDFVAQAQKPVADLARQARGNVENVSESFPVSRPGFAWWMPVAVIAAIGVAIWLFNTFFPRSADEAREQFGATWNSMAGTQQPFTRSESPLTENH